MRDPINTLQGVKLTSVEFVHDYVQLRFDGPSLTINAPFEILKKGRGIKKGASGFRDALCEMIGSMIREANSEAEKQLRLEFEDGTELAISLRPEDQISPEAAVLEDGSKNIRVWS